MAHAHDQTLLARLGFEDPDRKTPEHDLACRYLSQRDQLRKIVALYHPYTVRYQVQGKMQQVIFDKCISGQAVLEEPLTKGVGQYKTHVGFLDVVATFKFVNKVGVRDDAYRKIIIEVKIQPIEVSTILRQINLYKQQYADFGHETFGCLRQHFLSTLKR